MKQLLNKALKVSDNGLPKHLQPTKDSRDSNKLNESEEK